MAKCNGLEKEDRWYMLRTKISSEGCKGTIVLAALRLCNTTSTNILSIPVCCRGKVAAMCIRPLDLSIRHCVHSLCLQPGNKGRNDWMLNQPAQRTERFGEKSIFSQDWDSDLNNIFLQMKLQAWLVAHTVFNMTVSTIITNTEMLMSGGVSFYSKPSLANPSESCSSELNSFLLMLVCFSNIGHCERMTANSCIYASGNFHQEETVQSMISFHEEEVTIF